MTFAGSNIPKEQGMNVFLFNYDTFGLNYDNFRVKCDGTGRMDVVA